MASEFDICIVGGGLIGSAAACALADQGLKVALVESQPAPARISAQDDYGLRVSAINAASSQLFKSLGVWPAIKSVRVSPYTDMLIWDGPGYDSGNDSGNSPTNSLGDGLNSDIDETEANTANGKKAASIHFKASDLAVPQLGYIIENDVITQALADKLAYLPTVTLIQDQLEQIEPGKDLIKVQLGKQTIQAKLLIGADGQDSKVRALSHITTEYGLFDQLAVVARIQTELPHQQTAYQHFLHTGPIAYLPLADGSSSIVWSCDKAYAKTVMDIPEADFTKAVSEAMDQRLGKIQLLSQRGAFALKQIHAQRYISQRVALIGDAAHRTHPLAGLGANIGFVDAAALAETVANAHQAGRDIGLTHTLRKYERWRRGQNASVLTAMQAFKSVFASQSPGLVAARRWGLSMVDRTGPLKTALTSHAMGLAASNPASHSQTAQSNVGDLPIACRPPC